MEADTDPLLELVGAFYDAALDHSRWTGLSERIATALDATSAVVKLHCPGDRVRLLEMTPNMIVADDRRDWARYWHDRDLWVDRSISFGMSQIVTSDELVSSTERQRCGFYQEWLSALEIYHMIGAVFPTEGGAVGVIGVHRPHGAQAFEAVDRRRIALLLPHLQRALRLGQRITQDPLAGAVTLEVLDALDTGVVIADRRGMVRHLNVVAEAMLRRNDELAIRDGRLLAIAPPLQSRLSRALDDAVDLASGNGIQPSAAIRIDRMARPPWTLAVSPLRPPSITLAALEPLALILLRDPEYPPYLTERLRELFGLTRAEALTAAELTRGQPLPEIGVTLGIGLGTVRSHLKQIMLKTETNRQAEAVATISRSVAAMPAI